MNEIQVVSRRMRALVTLSLAGMTFSAIGCSGMERSKYLDQEHAPVGKGWICLLPENNMEGWKPRHADRPMSWALVDGVLVNSSGHDKKGVDIVTERHFDDFEIYYEYMLPEHSNSGLYLRGRYEIQILSDHGEEAAAHSNGGLYSKCAPAKNVSKPDGEWQSVYATIKDKTVNVWLNGFKTVDNFTVQGQTGGALDENYGTPGAIMLQGDHGSIHVRVLKIRPL
jgi:hypothetical protein